MASCVYYVADGKLYRTDENGPRVLRSLTLENYRKTAKEIEERREWKNAGAGAAFMGVAIQTGPTEIVTRVEAVAAVAADRVIYAATTETSCGLYTKDALDEFEPEGYVTRKLNTRFYHMDYDPAEDRIALSINQGGGEKHLALCGASKADYRVITEGDCIDITPSFSRRDRRTLFFSSAGFYRDPAKGKTYYDTYNLCRFNLATGEIEEVLCSRDYDFLRPKDTPDGRLYCLRRPKEDLDERGASVTDVLLVPFRMLKALFGWMNVFSQKYSGESLAGRTRGRNPAKQQDKSDQEMFIEGNLVNVTKTLKENQLRGESYPGIVPKSWELVRVLDGGAVEVVKKGVIDYTFDGDDLLYSNGKYILRVDADGREEKLCEARLAGSLSVPPAEEASELLRD